MTSIAVYTPTLTLYPEAKQLSIDLRLPFTETPETYDYLLLLTPDALSLQKTGDSALPLCVDFLAKKLTYRRQHASLRNEILARALGLKTKNPRRIIDATGGLARDSFIIASLGFEIILLERSPLVSALLQDGIKRAQVDPEVATILKRLQLVEADAITWLPNASPPDIIYLDPMFPERKKSALVKKEMRMFQAVLGEETDADALLKVALSCATQRVVVKRPRIAPSLLGAAPSFSMEGSSSRFDIYLI